MCIRDSLSIGQFYQKQVVHNTSKVFSPGVGPTPAQSGGQTYSDGTHHHSQSVHPFAVVRSGSFASVVRSLFFRSFGVVHIIIVYECCCFSLYKSDDTLFSFAAHMVINFFIQFIFSFV